MNSKELQFFEEEIAYVDPLGNRYKLYIITYIFPTDEKLCLILDESDLVDFIKSLKFTDMASVFAWGQENSVTMVNPME